MSDNIDIEKPQYSARQLAAASGLSKVLVQQYSDRNILRFTTVRVGGRTYRLFDYGEVVAAAVIAVLRNLGVVPSEIAEDARAASFEWLYAKHGDKLDKRLFAGLERCRFVVFVEGGTTPIFNMAESTLEQAMRNEQIRWRRGVPITGKPSAFVAIDLQQIERTVKAKLAELEKEQ